MIDVEQVSLVHGHNIEQSVRKSIELIGGLNLEPDANVVIKPNICNAKNPEGMVITDFSLIKAVVDLVRENGNDLVIVESDNISGKATTRMERSGLMGYLDDWDVDFINLSHDRYEEHQIAGTSLRLPKTVLEADYFINLPKIKTCAHTLVTLGIKNLYGVFQRKQKGKLHKHLNEILPFLAETIHNDLIIVDGINCMEGNGPVVGNPVCMDLVVAGRNLVSVDAVCSWLMGYDPAEIPHIALSAEKGLGPIDPESIQVVGEDWRDHVKEFEPPYSLRATLKSLRAIKDVYLS
ncbi:hypothetical protein DRO31_01150 [Candidatus Bathyarchaeota archaeon]|nr:MAG: hypothetical protein DRO31_01150 [Candidatus Bathyarchaeota archaeon]